LKHSGRIDSTFAKGSEGEQDMQILASGRGAPRVASLALAAVGAVGEGGAVHAQGRTIAPAPAFVAERLDARPTDEWITNGGNLANQRYSPLTLINRSNVGGLKAEWRASLMGSGITPRASNQAEPLYFDGVVYIATSVNDVFALDVDTGEIVWRYDGNVDPRVASPCCGWAVRGLALGDGKIFMGRLDAELVAIDQSTGEEVWSVQVADPNERYSITSAPRYYDGLVITGTSGGVMGTRGRVTAYDADTGDLEWRFYTIPGPGELGHDTWPADSEVWQYGGAAVWQTPAVDPELGLVYFSTSNPGPVLNGAVREGDNLFSASIVAIDAQTGEYRWHFQQVHHDIWDYDASNPVILFDAEIDGQPRKGLAQGGKTGWVYILDRTTGEPLIGIEERPVMQEPRQKTAATQPFPIGDPIVPQYIDVRPEGFEYVNEGRIFTPYFDEPVLWKPLAAINWPPSSYDPGTHLMYICASDGAWGATGGDPEYPVVPTGIYSGGAVYPSSLARRGIFAALDVTTNRIQWRQQWPEQCYSGSIATAGGLVFVGRNDGRLTALDSANGDLLWEFQTDGGVNAPAITFERNGRQYVAAYAGGTSLAPSKRSDGVWLFSLEGSIASLPRGSANPAAQFPGAGRGGPPGPPQGEAGGGSSDERAAGDDAAADEARGEGAPFVRAGGRAPDLAAGELTYRTTCVTCHGEDGRGGTHGGLVLTQELTLGAIVSVLANGRNAMPAYGVVMTPEELQDVAAYVHDRLLAP
jgi:alcohol dehydrogenase (cytochrome c)